MTRKSLIIGCGKQSEKHISGIAAVAPDRDVLVCDAVPAARDRLVAKFAEASGPKVSPVERPEDALADHTVDTVFICTPTATHAALAGQAVAAGKHFLCEKPLAGDLAEAETLVECTASAGVVGAVGYIYRAAAVFREGHALLAGDDAPLKTLNNALFRIGGRGSHAVWKHQRQTKGGAINEMLIHMLDLAQWYLGPAQEISVLDCQLRQPERIINGEPVGCDAEDYVLVKYTAPGTSAPVLIQADMNSPGFLQYLDIQAQEGAFVGSIVGSFDSHVFLTKEAADRKAGKTACDFPAENLFVKQTDAFLKAASGTPVEGLCSVAQDLENMRMTQRIREQAGF